MNKIEIPYLNRFKLMLVMLTVLIPLIGIIKLSVLFLTSVILYWIIDLVLLVVLVAIWYRFAFKVPGVRCTAYTWVEGGITKLQMKKDDEVMDLTQVEDIFMSEPSTIERLWGQKSLMLAIKNAGQKVVMISLPMDKDLDTRDTVFYALFMHLRDNNPQLIQEKDIKGAPIEFWFRTKDEKEEEY